MPYDVSCLEYSKTCIEPRASEIAQMSTNEREQLAHSFRSCKRSTSSSIVYRSHWRRAGLFVFLWNLINLDIFSREKTLHFHWSKSLNAWSRRGSVYCMQQWWKVLHERRSGICSYPICPVSSRHMSTSWTINGVRFKLGTYLWPFLVWRFKLLDTQSPSHWTSRLEQLTCIGKHSASRLYICGALVPGSVIFTDSITTSKWATQYQPIIFRWREAKGHGYNYEQRLLLETSGFPWWMWNYTQHW